MLLIRIRPKTLRKPNKNNSRVLFCREGEARQRPPENCLFWFSQGFVSFFVSSLHVTLRQLSDANGMKADNSRKFMSRTDMENLCHTHRQRTFRQISCKNQEKLHFHSLQFCYFSGEWPSDTVFICGWTLVGGICGTFWSSGQDPWSMYISFVSYLFVWAVPIQLRGGSFIYIATWGLAMPLLRVHALTSGLQGLFGSTRPNWGSTIRSRLRTKSVGMKAAILMMIQWNPHALVQGNLSSANDTCTGVYGDTTGIEPLSQQSGDSTYDVPLQSNCLCAW